MKMARKRISQKIKGVLELIAVYVVIGLIMVLTYRYRFLIRRFV